MTTMATGDDDNDIDGNNAMGNEVDDDGVEATVKAASFLRMR